MHSSFCTLFFFCTDTTPTEIYTLSLHDALPIFGAELELVNKQGRETMMRRALRDFREQYQYVVIDCPPSLGLLTRSEEHTSELQSLTNLVCRLLLEKKKKLVTMLHN